MKKCKLIFFTLLCIIQIFTLSSNEAYASNNKTQVKAALFITSSNSSSVNLEQQIRGVIKEFNENIHLKTEYLKLYNDDNEDNFYDYIKKSLNIYDNIQFVICEGDEATSFCVKYRDDLFKNMPISFLGVKDEEIINKALEKDLFSGVRRIEPIEENIDFIKEFNPLVDTITFIGNNIKNKYNNIVSKYNEFNFEYIDTNDVSIYQAEKVISKLDKNDAIIQLNLKNFKGNNNLNKEDINKYILDINPTIPIYNIFSTDVGYGSIGGKVINPSVEGEYAAKVAKNLLKGKNNKDIYIDDDSLNTYIFDYDYINKFGILESFLPDDSIILNSPREILKKYNNQIMIIVLVLIFISISLFLYIRNTIKCKKAMQLAMKETEELNKLKTHLIYNISHELRTPINVIMSALQVNRINIKNNNANENIYNLNIAEDNCNRLLRFINNIMDIQNAEFKQGKLQLSYINVVEVIENLVISIIPYANSKNLNIVFDTDEEEFFMDIDINKIERSVLNLLSNAIKFSNQNGEIRVNLKFEEDFCIIIEDQGIGIEKSKIDSIFNIFTQIDNSLCRKNEGSGIGLSITKYFVELHKGSIEVDSNIGEGAKFTIKLPINKSNNQNEQLQEELDKEKLCKNVKIELADIYL